MIYPKKGTKVGIWTVVCICHCRPKPFVWMKTDEGVYGRISVNSFIVFWFES